MSKETDKKFTAWIQVGGHRVIISGASGVEINYGDAFTKDKVPSNIFWEYHKSEGDIHIKIAENKVTDGC